MPGRRVDPSRYSDPSLIGRIVDQFQLAWRLLADPRVPIMLKVMIPALVALYTFSPIDIIPDFLLGLGQLDDLGVLLAALALFARLAPKAVVDEHRAAMAGGSPAGRHAAIDADDAIDADYSIGGRRAGATRQ
jgi:uncharacterized membrane protein YkvA (DUF1232 family)